MLATLAECNMHILNSKSQQRVICDTAYLPGHSRQSWVAKQTGSSVPKARNVNDSL